jgi:hypothetical protein
VKFIRSSFLAGLCLLVFLLVGCHSTNTSATTPAPVNSPQTQVLNIDKTLADAINAAVKAAIILRDQGKLSQANTTLIENWAKAAAILDDQIATELGSADTWAVQKTKILAMLPGFKIPVVSGLDPTLQADLVGITAIVAQIQGQVTQ